VPVVASRTGGLPEVVVDGESGFLAPIGAVDQMVGRCLELLQDPSRLQRMRALAVIRAAEFSADRVVPQYEALYQEVLDG